RVYLRSFVATAATIAPALAPRGIASIARVTFEPSQMPRKPVASETAVGSTEMSIIRFARPASNGSDPHRRADLSPGHPAIPRAPLRYKPVHLAHTGNWWPSRKNDRSGRWWQISPPAAKIIA